ncbi:MAG: hypothetical protein HQK49_18685 [Oligoflexia bacterium]|nr:hypothetical protein [Oligoflexia bacterium]
MDKTKTMSKKIIWVEQLSILKIFLLLPFSYLGYSIKYDNDDKQIHWSTRRLLSYLKSDRFIPFYINLTEKNDTGISLAYVHFDHLREIVCRFVDNNLKWATLTQKNMYIVYISNILYHKISFVTYVLNQKKTSKKKYVFLYNGIFNSLITSYFEDKNTKFLSLSIKNLTGVFLSMTSLFCKTTRGVSNYYLNLFKKSENLPKKDSLWIEFAPRSLMWDLLRKELFELYKNDDAKFDIVFYLDRSDTPLNDQMKKFLAKFAPIKYIDFHNHVSGGISFSHLFSALKKAKQCWANNQFYCNLLTIGYFIDINLLVSLYRKNNVKLLIQHQEASWFQAVQREALDEIGSMMLGHHWSNYVSCDYTFFNFFQNVYFSWGKITHDLVIKKNNSCELILPSGCLPSPRLNVDFAGTTEKKRSILILDSSVDNDCQHPKRTLSLFYEKIFEYIAARKNIIAYVKCKNFASINDLSSLPDGETLVALAEDLKKKNLLIFLNPIDYLPIEAAQQCEISFCYSLNSAGIISQINGHRAIHWDFIPWNKCPIYSHNMGKSIFNEIDNALDALDSFFMGDNDIGVMPKSLIKSIDYFQDFKGTKRMYEFIKDCFEFYHKQYKKDEILIRSSKRYIERNNINDSFFDTTTNLW